MIGTAKESGASARNNGGNDITDKITSWHIYEDMCCSSLVTWILMLMSTDDAMLPELSKVTSEKIVSVSDNIAMISSTSLTTSSIHGLSSGLSWQQLRARSLRVPLGMILKPSSEPREKIKLVAR
ncbi:hypothetical protein HKD37_15G042713 [Glycine soja]